MLGVGIILFTMLPQMLQDVALPAPLWVISLASLAQSAGLLALTVWVGVKFAKDVGLGAHAFEAAVSSQSVSRALKPQLVPGFVMGIVGGVFLFALGWYAPADLAKAQERFSPPLLARILYGGITEELLLRWGLMTLLVWLAWRFVQRRSGTPRALYVWVAIVVTALVFGAGHLPAAATFIGTLSAEIVVFVVGANVAFGVLFGYLFWRYGLEAAMIAHGTTHAVSHAANLLSKGMTG
jgi:membrane protease YdiL (CAAX protease family)